MPSLSNQYCAALFYPLFESAKFWGIESMAYGSAAARQALREPSSVRLPADFQILRETNALHSEYNITSQALVAIILDHDDWSGACTKSARTVR
jgi:hypothetical protein